MGLRRLVAEPSRNISFLISIANVALSHSCCPRELVPKPWCGTCAWLPRRTTRCWCVGHHLQRGHVTSLARLRGLTFCPPLLRVQGDGQVLAPFRLGMDEALREIHATLNDEVDWRIPRRHLCPRPTGSGPFHLLGVWFWSKVLQRHLQVTCNLVVKDLRPSVS